MKHYTFLDLATVNEPYFDEIQQALSRVCLSGRYIGGPEVERCEQLMRQQTGAAHTVGVSNGLDALRLIFQAYIQLGRMQPGDEVLVPSNTYIASLLAVSQAGLVPVPVEPRFDTMNIDSRRLEDAVTPRTRAILPVHLYGRIATDRQLFDTAARHNLLIVEDAAQAIGAADRDGRRAGNLGHAAGFSFYPTKNIGAMGDAGMVTTNDPQLADAVRALRNYGTDRQYHNLYQGLNCRLDPMQAAVLNVKLPHTDAENDLRAAIAEVYSQEIDNPHVTKPLDGPDRYCVWHQYVVKCPWRDQLQQFLADNGVETMVHYPTPPHLQPCYPSLGGLSLPVAESLGRQVLSLPVSRCTSTEDAREIARIINRFKPVTDSL